MARFDYRKLSVQERQGLVGELLEAMTAIKDKKDLQTFFLQLVTPSEAVMLSRRWQIAKRLASGHSYYRIAQELKVGIGTIEAVDRWLSEVIGDYRERLAEAQQQAAKRRHVRTTPVRMLPDMPAYLLLNLLVAGAARMWITATFSSEKKPKK